MGEEVARGNAAVNVDLDESETCPSASSVAFLTSLGDHA